MKKIFSILSTVLLITGLALYIAVLISNDNFLLGGVIVAVIGLVLAFLGENGVYKKVGLIGNAIIIIFGIFIYLVVIIPLKV